MTMNELKVRSLIFDCRNEIKKLIQDNKRFKLQFSEATIRYSKILIKARYFDKIAEIMWSEERKQSGD